MLLSEIPLVVWTDRGLYCQAGDFYIDPHRPVETAIVTHAHSDHARRGSKQYICELSGVGLLKSRLGQKIQVQGIPYRQTFTLGGVQVSFHSAGHILGSSQVRIQVQKEVWVISGDYKRESDPSCDPFEVVPCDTFITEATFGTPKYVWNKNSHHGDDIFQWWKRNRDAARNSLLFGYSLGKAQRILAELKPFADQPILIHDSMVELTKCYRSENRCLASTRSLSSIDPEEKLRGELILAPPSVLKSEWLNRLGNFETAFASGWMQGSSFAHGLSYNHGFVISDHADWNDLNRTIEETHAKQVFVLHRGNGALIRHLRKKGINAYPITALTPKNYSKFAEANLSLF
jgi:putative mRNA 3-end processing factor